MACAKKRPSSETFFAAFANCGTWVRLEGRKIDLSVYQYLGSWPLNQNNDWKDSIRVELKSNDHSVRLSSNEAPLPGALPQRLSSDSEAAYFKTISWGNEQVSVFSLCAVAASPGIVMLELDADNRVAIYNNGGFIREINPSSKVETGGHLFIPVTVDKGNNLLLIKILSFKQAPRLRAVMILDQSRDFQAAWSANMGFLDKCVFPAASSAEAPTLKWDGALRRLEVSAVVRDCLTGTVVMTREKLKTGSVIRDGPIHLREGLYKIVYASGENSTSEFFLIGSPRKTFENLKNLLQPSLAGEGETRINIEAQIRRGEILLDRKNYDSDNREWQAKVAYTLCLLAGLVKKTRDGVPLLPRDETGLHIRGMISQADRSTQFYSLYVPSMHASGQSIPLLIIAPTPMGDRRRPFIESPAIASHYQTLQICQYAEKYGFAVLWPGYRNAPEGWPSEASHIDEVIRIVAKDCNIDQSGISIYGICGGGFCAGRLTAIYPRRFAAIVYDRAYYDGCVELGSYAPDSMKYWHRAIDPTRKVIGNKNLKIFVINDGSKPEGHGEMEVSERFLEMALKTRPDIKYALGQRPAGVELWDQVFGWLKECKNENYSEEAVNDLASYGYAGPICEVFATPFIVVEGTAGDAEGNARIQEAVKALQEQYGQQFFGASFVLKKDSEITDEDTRTHSLVLVGNPESNGVWGKLQADLSAKLTPEGLTMEGQTYPKADAFDVITRNPANMDYYVLLIGAGDLRHLPLTKVVNPTRATFDCCLLEPYGEYHRQRIITTLGKAKDLLSTDGAARLPPQSKGNGF